MKKFKVKKEKGITIISLIITIVILLILAGISIAMFTSNSLPDKAFESKIVTELSQLGEEVNKIKVQGEQESIQEGIYSGSVTNDTLINKQIIISTATINNPPIKLGIIDISKFNVDSELGKNFNSYSSDSTFTNITDLSDVYAINLETNDIYYITDISMTLDGNGILKNVNGEDGIYNTGNIDFNSGTIEARVGIWDSGTTVTSQNGYGIHFDNGVITPNGDSRINLYGNVSGGAGQMVYPNGVLISRN